MSLGPKNRSMFADDLLKGHRILVTGGGSGLGKSIAARYLESGAEVFICGRSIEKLEAAVAELKTAYCGSITALACDLRNPASIAATLDAIWQTGPLTGLVNNAAANFIARSETLSPRAFDAVVNTVLHGTAYVTMDVGRRWIAEARPGSIISIVTPGAWLGRAFQMPNAAAKAGVLSLTRSLAVEWGNKGIRCVAVSPGIFPTEGSMNAIRPNADQRRDLGKEIPMRRVGDHRELTSLTTYLMAPDAAYINGDCISIDGGRVLLSGAGAGAADLLDWTNEDWARLRSSQGR